MGKTPVIAFRTGGLKDSVIEFKWDSEEGSGFTFDNYNHQEFMAAIDRALAIYPHKQKYAKLRENAFRATMSGEVVCKAWLGEFCKLSQKEFVDQKRIDNIMNSLDNWSIEQY